MKQNVGNKAIGGQAIGHKVTDWQHVRHRLEKAIAATNAAHQLAPDRARVIMDERAALLARAPDVPPSAAETLELLTFSLGQERYALDTSLVREVQRQPDVTFVPGAPQFVQGVANLRGEILAVVDLGELFALGGPQRESCPWLIVLGNERAEFGIVCDSVDEVVTLRIDALRAAPGSLNTIAREFVRGVTSEALVVLAGESLLSDSRLFIDQSDETKG